LRYLQLLCLAAALAPALSAGSVVFGNITCGTPGAEADSASCITEPSAGSDPINSVDGEGPIYDSFTSGAAGQIDDLQLILGLCDCFPQGSFQVGLYTDNLGTPGAEIGAALATVSDSSLSTTPAVYDIALSVPVNADTVYWIGLSGTTTDAEWYYDSDDSGIGVEGESYSNVSGLNSDVDGAYQMQVTTATPEPASIFLIVAGAGVLALLRRRTA
jgi:hypothetical protein